MVSIENSKILGGHGMQPGALGKREAAQHLALSVRTLERLIADGALPAVRVGRRVVIRTATLEAFLAAHEHTGEK